MATGDEIRAALRRGLAGDRVHSAYLLSGPGAGPRETATWWARMLVCDHPGDDPCEACPACRRSAPREEISLDGTGKKGPLLRHVGDHADLLWVERGESDTRVRIGQIRALQKALRLRGSEGGRRTAVIADAEWLNAEAQNALLRLLEEPPERHLPWSSSAGSAGRPPRRRSARAARRYACSPRPRDADTAGPRRRRRRSANSSLSASTACSGHGPERADGLGRGVPAAPRAVAAEPGCRRCWPWAAEPGCAPTRPRGWSDRPGRRATTWRRSCAPSSTPPAQCRKDLAQRNANPQMVAERALFAVRSALANR